MYRLLVERVAAAAIKVNMNEPTSSCLASRLAPCTRCRQPHPQKGMPRPLKRHQGSWSSAHASKALSLIPFGVVQQSPTLPTANATVALALPFATLHLPHAALQLPTAHRSQVAIPIPNRITLIIRANLRNMQMLCTISICCQSCQSPKSRIESKM